MNRAALYLGVMSGTSQDGVDAAIVEFRGICFQRVVATHSIQYPRPLRRDLLQLSATAAPLTLAAYCELDQAVARAFAASALGVLRRARLPAGRIVALGSHGQTVYHAPTGRIRSSVQLGDPNLISALTGITTVADFRRRDMALGGQGAPLVPAFHHALFATRDGTRCVVNIGGIANITVLRNSAAAAVTGFDTGPGNALMDEWAWRVRNWKYDAGGRWAATGEVNQKLLRRLLRDNFFQRRPPKSTGRDYFNLQWARRRYPALGRLPAASVQRTLLELTARNIADAVERQAVAAREILVCGGGVHNRALMSRLRGLLAPRVVQSTVRHGIHPQWVEAAAFAWLAMRTLNGLPGNLPAVTGASGPAILGGIYRA
jgi:anhydro-N-acetylmuramic acid kinase